MTISKRVLTKWRKEALITLKDCPKESKRSKQARRILQLTQELIDHHLMEKK